MKSKVLLTGFVIAQLMFVMGSHTKVNTPIETTSWNYVKPEASLPQTLDDVSTDSENNTPIEDIKPTETVIARKTFAVNRGGDPREYTVTDKSLESVWSMDMRGTAYTLSVASCGKSRSNPGYGITRNGTKAEPHRTVAIDTKILPLGSVVYIKFPEQYSNMDGLYVAEDTGSAIHGDIIDIFFGEDAPGSNYVEKQAKEFGVQRVTVYLIE